MNKDLNFDQQVIRVSYTQEINKELQLGDQVNMFVKGIVVKQEVYDNQDGTVNIKSIVKPNLVEFVE